LAPATTSQKLDYSKLLKGIKKWPECMTTSPSRCHLGIYKSLGKHVVEKKKHNNSTTQQLETEDGLTQG